MTVRASRPISIPKWPGVYDAGLGPDAVRSGLTFDPSAEALFARMAVQPTDARKVLYNTFIVSLKTAGVWAKRDTIYLLAAHTSQAALLNIKQNAFNATAVSAPTFTTDRGFTSAGVGSYLDTGYTPSTSGGVMTLNNASIASYVNTNVAVNAPAIQASTAIPFSFISHRNLSDQFNAAVNADAGATIGTGLTTSVGYRGATRTDAANIRGRFNGGFNTVALASSSLPTSAFIMCGIPTNSYTGRVAYGASGSHLTDAEMAAEDAAVVAFLTAIGAN